MKVSHTELVALCRQAFEGMGFPPGDHEDAADMVVWLEQHGLEGVDALWRGLDHLISQPRRPMARPFEDASLSVLDAADNSILVCGGLAVDLVYAKARRKGLAVVKVRNCYNRKLMLGYVARCARRGMNVMVFWRDRDDPEVIEQVASIRAWEAFPTLLRYQIADPDETLTRNHSVTLLASPHFAMLQSLHPAPDEATLLQTILPREFECQSQRTWEHGLDVDGSVWSRLKELSGRTLVESTEASRNRGAGEGAV